MRTAVALLAVASCIPPDEAAPVAAAATGPLALYRIDDGDCLSGIAQRLGYRGGWKALAETNGMTGDFIVAGHGLKIALDHLPPGIDPYADLGLVSIATPTTAATRATRSGAARSARTSRGCHRGRW